MKTLIPLLTVLLVSSAIASPLDTAYDLLDAVTYQDGYALQEILSSDLYDTFTVFIDQMRALAEEDPSLVQGILQERYNGRVSTADFELLNNQEIMGLLIGEVVLQPDENIERERVEMEGRSASVVLSYFNGGSISFQMVWEDGDWRITDTSLLSSLFH